MAVLGLDLGYTVKYNPLPSGVPSGFALGNSLRQRVIFDRTSLVSLNDLWTILVNFSAVYENLLFLDKVSLSKALFVALLMKY